MGDCWEELTDATFEIQTIMNGGQETMSQRCTHMVSFLVNDPLVNPLIEVLVCYQFKSNPRVNIHHHQSQEEHKQNLIDVLGNCFYDRLQKSYSLNQEKAKE